MDNMYSKFLLLCLLTVAHSNCIYYMIGEYLQNPTTPLIAIRFITNVVDVISIEGFTDTAFDEKFGAMIIIGLPCGECDGIVGNKFKVTYTTSSNSYCKPYSVTCYAYYRNGTLATGILPSQVQAQTSLCFGLSNWMLLIILLIIVR